MSQTPDKIGPYEVVRPIAQGGMAEVYEVVDPSSGERMALKLLAEAKSSVKRFNREFEALTQLNHPGIVRVYRYGYHGRQPWLTMELLTGEPLQTWVKEIGEPGDAARTSEVVRIGYFICQALQYIHDRGLVHRDLKSANVQVLPDGRVKIIDFGTAHLAHPLERITQEGDFVGTFSYAAPEQIVGSTVDARADLYSLGVLLYRMASGRRPFKATEPQKVAQLHLKVMARPIRELVPEVPEALDRVVQWLMEKRRADRPQSAEEVARALEEIAGSALTLPGAGLALETGRSVGREAEHRKVWSLVGDATGVRLVLVSGGDGREQRRFAAQVASDAGRRSMRGVRVGPSDDPARALVAAFRSLALGQGSAAAARLLGVVGDGRSIVARSTASLGTYVIDDVAELIAEHDRPTVFVLEDAEGLDASAMSLLQLLAGACQRHKARLTLVATVTGPDSAAGTALRRVIAQVGTVFLAPLDVRETALTLGELLHRRPAPMELARLVHQRSQGHPSRVEATLRALVDDGAIAVRDDDDNRIEWTGAAGEEIRFQASLDDVEARLDRLPIVARRALEVVAMAGGLASRKVLAAGLGWSEAATELLADDLIERSVLRGAQATDELEAFDPVLLHTINLQLLPARRFVIQQLIADVIPLDPPTPAVVRTLLAVGRSEAALRLGLMCGLDMLQRGIIHEALTLMEELSGAANHPGLESAARAEYHLLLGRLVRAVRPMDPRSIRSIHAADRLVVAPEDKARVQEAYAEVQAAIGHQGNYRKHLLQGWELAGPAGGPVAAHLALKLAWSRLNEGDLQQASVWAGRARAADGTLTRRVSILDAAVDLLRGDLGRADEVLQALIAGPTEDPVARWDATVVRAHVLRRQGRYSEALAPLERALEESRDGVSPVSWVRLLLAVGEVELDLARLGAAQERVDEALAAMFRGESLELRLSARLVHGRIQVASGQLAAARYVLNEVKEQADLAGLTLLAERARGALAEALWAVGQRKESMELFRGAIVRLMEVGDVVSLVDVVIARARSVGGLEDPAKSFKPVAALLDRPEFRVLYLESCLAELRWARAKDDASGVARALAESQSVFNGMAARQARVEQAALRVHPWMRELRRVLEK